MWGSDRLRAGRQEVGKCSTRGESWGMYITFASAKIANKAEPTLALKPRGDVTRNPKQGYQWPQKRTCVYVSAKNFLKKKKRSNVDNKQPGRLHNGSTFVFCSCGCPFESKPSPTSAHACGEVTGCTPATKRLASVALKVDLRECTLHLPPQK